MKHLRSMLTRYVYTFTCVVVTLAVLSIHRAFLIEMEHNVGLIRVVSQDSSVKQTLQLSPGEPSAGSQQENSAREEQRKNVLFIVSDDLRPQLNTYSSLGQPNPRSQYSMYTPHLDKLARRSLLLTQAHVQYSICAPSRASYMTGRRPDTTHVWDLTSYWRTTGGNFTSLPQHFKNHGYVTAGTGKIYHPGSSSNNQDPPSWTQPWVMIPDNWWKATHKKTWKAVGKDERAQRPLQDEMVADKAIEYMRNFAPTAKTGEHPFFLAVGFHKPHLPWVCAGEYWNMYEMKDMDLLEYSYLPWKYPESAFYPSTEFMHQSDLETYNYTGEMNETFPDNLSRDLRRAYFACVSYVDGLVGRLLRELRKLGLADSTVVTFLGDHGYHLGENGLWGKHTNFDYATRAPVLLHVPGLTDRRIVSGSLVEFVDLFPTVVEAAGLEPIPSCPRDSRNVALCTDGISFMPLVENPNLQLKDAVYSQLRMFKGIDGMHYSMRTEHYRYNEVVAFNRTQRADGLYDYNILWESAPGVELYNLVADPTETRNVAYETRYLRIQGALSRKLHEFVDSNFASHGVNVLI